MRGCSCQLERGQTAAELGDVGTNSVEDASRKQGYRLVGDVQYDRARYIAGKITPVPGGVGPMTIAMLLVNTLKSAERAYFGDNFEER